MDDITMEEALALGLLDRPYDEPTQDELWELFRAHERDAVMSGGFVDDPREWGLL